MRMTGGPSGLPRLLSSKHRDESMLTFHLTLIFREDDGRIDPWWWELVSRGHEADKAGEAVQAGKEKGKQERYVYSTVSDWPPKMSVLCSVAFHTYGIEEKGH